MSAGTPKVVVRIDGGLMEDIEIQIAQRNWFSREEAWTVSDFIRIACREKLEKMRRSRNRKRKPKTTA